MRASRRGTFLHRNPDVDYPTLALGPRFHLLVLGEHQINRLEPGLFVHLKTFLPMSVTQVVVHGCECPVILLRGDRSPLRPYPDRSVTGDHLYVGMTRVGMSFKLPAPGR